MNRRSFFKALLGLALLPFVSKVEAAPPIIIPAPILPKPIKPRLSEDGVYKYKVTYTTPLLKTDKGIWMLDHWCDGHYEAIPLYPGDFNSPQSAKWICNCKPLTKDELVKHNHLGSVVYQLPDPKPGMQFKFEATDYPIIIKD